MLVYHYAQNQIMDKRNDNILTASKVYFGQEDREYSRDRWVEGLEYFLEPLPLHLVRSCYKGIDKDRVFGRNLFMQLGLYEFIVDLGVEKDFDYELLGHKGLSYKAYGKKYEVDDHKSLKVAIYKEAVKKGWKGYGYNAFVENSKFMLGSLEEAMTIKCQKQDGKYHYLYSELPRAKIGFNHKYVKCKSISFKKV